ncbi:MAG: permease-like cell division protein FtsX [Butyricicoccus sp.]|nr:permease-like cell division protein FtsX [Butyricicoccus sp.]
MKIRLSSIAYFWKEGIRNIFLHGFMSFAAISVIIVCLIITGSVTLVSYNVDLNILKLQQESEIAIYIDDSVPTETAMGLQTVIEAIPNVAGATFESGGDALEDFRVQLGDDAVLLDGYTAENSPLRDGYYITMHDVTLVDETIDALEEIDGVANIVVKEDVINKLIQVQKVFRTVSVTLVIALGLISIFIISNTVKLAMIARRDEISIQKMVGATNGFIRGPFIIEGMLLGLFAALLAFGLEWWIYSELTALLSTELASFTMASFEDVMYLVLGTFAGSSILVGICGSSLTIRRFMDV